MGGSAKSNSVASSLADLRHGEGAVLDRIDLPDHEVQRLMELGFLPGTRVSAASRSPFGHTRVFRVDGSEVALRWETAAQLIVREISPQDKA